VVLGFARALGEFGATVMVAGNIPGRTSTIALSIYEYVQLGEDSAALKLLAFSVLMAFGAVWISEFVIRRRLPAR
jgi:molybdate transport system permease protein